MITVYIYRYIYIFIYLILFIFLFMCAHSERLSKNQRHRGPRRGHASVQLAWLPTQKKKAQLPGPTEPRRWPLASIETLRAQKVLTMSLIFKWRHWSQHRFILVATNYDYDDRFTLTLWSRAEIHSPSFKIFQVCIEKSKISNESEYVRVMQLLRGWFLRLGIQSQLPHPIPLAILTASHSQHWCWEKKNSATLPSSAIICHHPRSVP